MIREQIIWVEKWRPHTIKDCILPESLRKIFQSYVDKKIIPNMTLSGGPGIGKCLAPGTNILMFDGTIKKVENILIGDRLMGPDSKPRKVLNLASGKDKMYEVIPNKGKSFTCNKPHILALKYKGTSVEISVENLLGTKKIKDVKLYRTNKISFIPKIVPLDPYFLGIWLGDGTSSCPEITNIDPEILDYCKKIALSFKLEFKNRSQINPTISYSLSQTGGKENPITHILRKLDLINNKHVPQLYKINSEKIRLQILAGLIDSDGGFQKIGKGYEFYNKSEVLAEDVAYIARSLGFAAYIKSAEKVCSNSKNKTIGIYYCVSIYGDFSKLPIKVERKKFIPRKINKDPLVSGIKEIRYKGVGKYYGFQIDGDGLFVLGDFTVTHNTTVARALCDQLDADFLVINCSENGNIDTLRTDIRGFSSTVSMTGGRKVVLLDEADGLTGITQQALRAFIEEFAGNCSFILTCNFKNQIIDALHSRCPLIEFKPTKEDKVLMAKQMHQRVVEILKKEKIPYEDKIIAQIIMKFFPDFRETLGTIQKFSIVGKIDSSILASLSEVPLKELLEAMKVKDFTKVRKWVADNIDNEPTRIYRQLFDAMYAHFKPAFIPQFVLILGDFLDQAGRSLDQEITLLAFLTRVMADENFEIV